MLTLISIELKKIFHRKSIYVMFSLMTVFCLLNNVLYKIDYDEDGNYKYQEQTNIKEEKQSLERDLKEYNPNNSTEVTMYITIKTKLDLITLKEQFQTTSWQYHQLNTYLYDTIYELNYYQYVEPNQEKQNQLTQEYKSILTKLKSDDWQYFLNQKQENLKQQQTELNAAIKITIDNNQKEELENNLKEIIAQQKIINYRLKNNIKEDSSYLNLALETYLQNHSNIKYYQNRTRTQKEEIAYQENLASLKVNQYILNKKQNINQVNNVSYQLRTIVEDYELFLVILILMISSTIICDEFKDGTIKLLLIKPYTRGKILLSKYFTSILILFLSILFLIFLQLTIGGFIFGLNSLKLPVVIYNFNTNKLVEYSIFQYMTIRILARLPFFLIMMFISFLFSTIFTSTVISITIPLLLYLFSSMIDSIAIRYQLIFLKYLPSVNWNLEDYLFGKITEIPFINLKFSSIILLVYLFSIGILTYIIFKKKEIKNI